TFFFTMLIFTMISIIIDFSDRVDELVKEDVKLFEIIFVYYLNWIMWINGLLFPLYALIAVIFFTSRLAYNSEIISILNAEVSFRCLMFPYLLASGFLCILNLVGNHYFIPLGNKKHFDLKHTYIWTHNDKGKTSDVHMFLEPQTVAYIKYYRKQDSTARDIQIKKFVDNDLTFMLKSRSAQWLGPPNNWRLSNYEIRTFDGLNETLRVE